MLGHGRCWMKRLQRYQKRCSFGLLGAVRDELAQRLDDEAEGEEHDRQQQADRGTAALWPVTTPTNAPTTAMPTAISAARDVLSIRVPTQPSNAGSSVSEARIIISTPSAEATATPVHEAEPDQEQAEQRDDHGDAGEQHGPPAGVDRLDDGLLDARGRARSPRGSG